MAQLLALSTWSRPVHRQLSLWTWRSRLHSRASLPECAKHSRTIQGVSSHLMCQYKIPRVQSTHAFSSSSLDSKSEATKKFHLIYKFPGIRICKVVSKLKIMQTALTVVFLPPIYYCYLQGQVTYFSVVYCTGIALFAGAMLYSLTYYLRRIIGMMYINQEATTLKISHLTFWGNRRDIYLPIEDVKRFSETGDSKGEVLFQFKRYSSPNILYFTLRFGQILDKEKFSLIFGEIK